MQLDISAVSLVMHLHQPGHAAFVLTAQVDAGELLLADSGSHAHIFCM